MILNGPGHMTFLTFDTYVDSIISLVHPSGDQWYILLEAIEADPLLPLRPQSLWPQQETHLSLGNANGNIHYSKGKPGGCQGHFSVSQIFLSKKNSCRAPAARPERPTSQITSTGFLLCNLFLSCPYMDMI